MADGPISGAIPNSDPRRRPCWKRPGARRAAPAGSRSSSAPRPASARPTRCCRARAPERKDGYDVVVGVVETHGRTETEALLEGLEVIPRKRLEYKGQSLEEMDLDAHHRAPPADRAGRRTRPHQRAGQPPSQALSGRRGTAQPRHRRLHHGQHPAHREPQRRRRPDHRMCGCARPCRTRCSTAPTRSSWSTSRRTT